MNTGLVSVIRLLVVRNGKFYAGLRQAATRVTGQLQDPVHFYVFCVENRRVDHLNYFSYVEIYEGKSDTHGRVNA